MVYVRELLWISTFPNEVGKTTENFPASRSLIRALFWFVTAAHSDVNIQHVVGGTCGNGRKFEIPIGKYWKSSVAALERKCFWGYVGGSSLELFYC
jgi:hypothetical protein